MHPSLMNMFIDFQSLEPEVRQNPTIFRAFNNNSEVNPEPNESIAVVADKNLGQPDEKVILVVTEIKKKKHYIVFYELGEHSSKRLYQIEGDVFFEHREGKIYYLTQWLSKESLYPSFVESKFKETHVLDMIDIDLDGIRLDFKKS